MNDRVVGLVGLGLLGSAIADRLLAAGFQVIGFDLAEERCRAIAEHGATVAPSAEDLVARCRRIILCLPSGVVSAAVVAGLGEIWKLGQIVVDTTTGAPEEMVSIGSELAMRGVRYLDATVAGSSAQLRAAEAVMFVGGDATDVAACSDLLAALSPCVLRVGPLGAGSRMKLVHNLILGLHRAVLAEGLTLARALGFEATQALEMLKQTPARSAVMETKGLKMATGDFAPQATIAQHLKDVQLMLETARQTGLALPLTTCHEQLLEAVVAAGFGSSDNSAIIKAFGPAVTGNSMVEENRDPR